MSAVAGCHVVDAESDSQPRGFRASASNCNLAWMDQTWPRRKGGFGPVSLPLFQAGLPSLTLEGGLLSFMSVSVLEKLSTLTNLLADRQLPNLICLGMVTCHGPPTSEPDPICMDSRDAQRAAEGPYCAAAPETVASRREFCRR
jgi:hypothetical protein